MQKIYIIKHIFYQSHGYANFIGLRTVFEQGPLNKHDQCVEVGSHTMGKERPHDTIHPPVGD